MKQQNRNIFNQSSNIFDVHRSRRKKSDAQSFTVIQFRSCSNSRNSNIKISASNNFVTFDIRAAENLLLNFRMLLKDVILQLEHLEMTFMKYGTYYNTLKLILLYWGNFIIEGTIYLVISWIESDWVSSRRLPAPR